MGKQVESYQIGNRRLQVIMLSYIVLIGILWGALAWRQVMRGEKYQKQMERQNLRRIVLAAPRGEIYDRNGELLVANRPVFNASVFVGELRHEIRKKYRKQIKLLKGAGVRPNRDQVIQDARYEVIKEKLEELNKLLERNETISKKEIKNHFYHRLLLPLTLVKDLSVDEYAMLIQQIPVESPIQVTVDSARHYPHGSLAAHVLGYVGNVEEKKIETDFYDDLTTLSLPKKVGKSGLEKQYNDLLDGEYGGEIWLVDPDGYRFESLEKEISKKGQDLYTSIDIDLQLAAEAALGNRKGAVVMMKVQTGEVLVMASGPTYDLNELTPFISTESYERINEEGGWLNRAHQGLYPPASPFKVITATAALRHKLIDPEGMVDCGPHFEIGNRKIKEHNKVGFGPLDFKNAVRKSSNYYFVDTGMKVGWKHLSDEAKRFHLHEPTGIDLPFETKSMLVPTERWKMNRMGERWRGGDTGNMCIGQGFLRNTPLQMCCLAASFAREETLTKPSLLRFNDDWKSFEGSEKIGIDEIDYGRILEGMIAAVEDGSARKSKVSGLSFAAKTGTGEVKSNKEYSTIPWMMGFGPVEAPDVAISVVIEGEPGLNLWGGHVAAPVGQMVLQAYYDKYLAKETEGI